MANEKLQTLKQTIEQLAAQAEFQDESADDLSEKQRAFGKAIAYRNVLLEIETLLDPQSKDDGLGASQVATNSMLAAFERML